MADASATSEDATVTFNVKASSGPKVTVTLPVSTTIADLKTKLAEPDMANVPAASQRLIYSGKVLKDHETIATYKVKDGNTMHLVRSAPSNQRQNPAAQSTPSSNTTSTTAPPTGVPQNFAAGTGNDPLAGLTGARYAGFAGLPSLESLAHPPSADEIARRMNDPNFAQQMNEALQNPHMIDMMINSHPQLRAMGPQARQWLQSEDFRRMMTNMMANPDTMRNMMEMQRGMGGGPFGMGGGQDAFPMPGATNTTDAQHQNNAPGGQQQGQRQNHFGNAFGGGLNPFMFMQPPPAGTERSANPSANAANPFAAMFNPALAQPPAQGQQTGQTDTNTTESTESSHQTSQPPNPFADNPFPPHMYNNPMLQQMMRDPQALQNAMQMVFGGEGNHPFGAFGGGLGQPADNRPPEERYSTQLRQLNEMGFHDFDRNIQALGRSGGDVNGALEWLFSQPPSS